MGSAFAIALLLAVGDPVHAAAPGGPFAGYREDGALSCDQLRAEIVASRDAVARLTAKARAVRLADTGLQPPASPLVLGVALQNAALAAPAGHAAAQRQVRLRGAERRARAAQARNSLLAGLYQAKSCGGGERRRGVPPQQNGQPTAMGAAD